MGRVFHSAGGKPARVVAVSLDISEERSLQQRLRQSQKLEALGQLAGSIAHDFNNILTVILSASHSLGEELKDRLNASELAQEIHDAGGMAAGLVKQILAFSRRQELNPRPVDLSDAIAEMLPMLLRLIAKPARIRNECTAPGPIAVVDPNQLQQVVLNLAVNARDAMPTGGDLFFRVARARAGAPRDDGTPGEEQGWAVLEVADTGTGMSPEVRARLFEPFFTTKGEGKGTGLGLATVYGIVRQSGGFIEIESEVGQGTTFRVYFPDETHGAS